MKRKNEILKYLSEDDQLLFLSELLDAIMAARRKDSFLPIDECMERWEATAELSSVPGLRESVWERYNKLKSSGAIHG